MRTLFPPQYDPDLQAIDLVLVDCQSRHELVPILRALQHLYSDKATLDKLQALIQQDINKTTSPTRGRSGLSYWEILVLASVRLGCNLDYDQLQDLAHSHTLLRQILGVDPQPNPDQTCRYKWHRLRDTLCLLQPETLVQINHLIVSVGHRVQGAETLHVRGDTFVVETNIHYPTESSLLGDGLRKILDLVEQLLKHVPLPEWRQRKRYRKDLKKALRAVSKAGKSKAKNASERLRQAYEVLYQLADKLLTKGQHLRVRLQSSVSGAVCELCKQLQSYLRKTAKVQEYSRRRVLQGEKIANEEKIFSMFESETELINRGKSPNPIQFGHLVLVIEDHLGFICDYKVLDRDESEETMVREEMSVLQERVRERIGSCSFDSGFHSPENQEELPKIIGTVCIPQPGKHQGARQEEGATSAYHALRRYHAGVESLVGVLQRGNG